MRGKPVKAALGLTNPNRVWIQLTNKTKWYREFSSPEAANRAVQELIRVDHTISLKSWTKHLREGQ